MLLKKSFLLDSHANGIFLSVITEDGKDKGRHLNSLHLNKKA